LSLASLGLPPSQGRLFLDSRRGKVGSITLGNYTLTLVRLGALRLPLVLGLVTKSGTQKEEVAVFKMFEAVIL